MCWGSALVYNRPVPVNYQLFVFFSTICSYNFHWYLTPATNDATGKGYWSLNNKKLHLFLFVAGGILAVYFGLQLLAFWPWLLAAGLLTFLYSAPKLSTFRFLKYIAVAKTAFLALLWTYVTCIFPLLFENGAAGTTDMLYAVNRFFLIYAICVLFDYRDREVDQREGIRSLVTELNEKGINILFGGSMAVFGISSLALFLLRQDEWLNIMILIPGIVLLLLYRSSKKDFSDLRYYFILDGLMALTPFLQLLHRISLNLAL
jgi:4-hydroxybenzoate polyprenyltransferase